MNKKIMVSALALTLAATSLTACGGINKNDTLITIENGDKTDEISLGTGNFYARLEQAAYGQMMMAYYGESVWTTDITNSGQTYQEDTKDGVIETIKEYYICQDKAAEYGVELSEDQEKAIKDAASQFIKDNSEETIEAMGATEEYVADYLRGYTYQSLVSKAVKEEADDEVTDDECWMRTFTYALVDTTGVVGEDGSTVEYTEEELKGLKTTADTIAAAEDFDAALTEAGIEGQSFSYLKGETENSTIEAAVLEAAEGLKEGQVSDVISVDGKGYYVIRLDKDHDSEQSESKRQSLQTQKQNEYYETKLQEWKDAITWTVDEDAWEKVQFDTMFNIVSKEDQEATEETTEDNTEEPDDTAEAEGDSQASEEE
ncbi:MAG: peptidyl-prolyl cis-trans isomerase [Pseudobutyrivibrio sp.]|nr:peptidyl-prolyl cis-trans isomerase [Pseudobutyrivibrio sp.]